MDQQYNNCGAQSRKREIKRKKKNGFYSIKYLGALNNFSKHLIVTLLIISCNEYISSIKMMLKIQVY